MRQELDYAVGRRYIVIEDVDVDSMSSSRIIPGAYFISQKDRQHQADRDHGYYFQVLIKEGIVH